MGGQPAEQFSRWPVPECLSLGGNRAWETSVCPSREWPEENIKSGSLKSQEALPATRQEADL